MSRKKDIMDYLGITKWHEAGYTGKGIKIMSVEPVSSKSKFPNVIAVNGYNIENLKEKNHADKVMEQMMVIAPDSEFYTCSKKGSVDGTWKPLYLDYILKNNIHLFTSSKLSDVYATDTTREKYMQECIDNGTTFCIGAGNMDSFGGKKIAEEAKSDKWLAIGACTYDEGQVGKAFYSCEGEELDYMMISGWNGESGTSFATNRFCAMLALVQQFFNEKIGRTLYRNELIRFIHDNLKDLRTEGFDIYTGHGLLILPEPSTIDVSKYVADIDVGEPGEGIYYGGFPEIGSDVVMRGIDKLHPELQVCVNKFLEECKNKGLDVCITETLRTQEEQEALYAQGRTKPGKIVTNCRGFQSSHCWGVAFDFCRHVKGKEYDNSDKFFDKVGEIAKTIFDNTEYDLFWGGDFKTFVDKPHIEMKKYLPNNSTVWLIDHFGTPEEFMATWYDMKEEGGDYVHRYKTVEEMPVYAQDDIEQLVNDGILSGKGGELGLDLTEDMIRILILTKRMIERGK